MLVLLGLVYVVALGVVVKEKYDDRRLRRTVDLSALPAEDRPPATAPKQPVPTNWVGLYVEEGITAISEFLSRRDQGSAS